jgi:hypothetical protein
MITRLRIGNTHLTRDYLLHGERRPFLEAAEHMLVECQFYDEERH